MQGRPLRITLGVRVGAAPQQIDHGGAVTCLGGLDERRLAAGIACVDAINALAEPYGASTRTCARKLECCGRREEKRDGRAGHGTTAKMSAATRLPALIQLAYHSDLKTSSLSETLHSVLL